MIEGITRTIDARRFGSRAGGASHIGSHDMKQISFNTQRTAALTLALLILAGAALGADHPAPRIELSNVPLVDAIKNLARQSGLNYILDPHVPGSGLGAGRLAVSPSVTALRTNMTAEAALGALIKEHQLTMVASPATTITRIAPAKLRVKPVPAGQVGTNASSVIPLLVLDSVPLTEAVTRIAEAARLTVSLDPKVSAPAIDPQGSVSFRWERVTARQALAALLDNYGLEMTEDTASATARITVRPMVEREQP